MGLKNQLCRKPLSLYSWLRIDHCFSFFFSTGNSKKLMQLIPEKLSRLKYSYLEVRCRVPAAVNSRRKLCYAYLNMAFYVLCLYDSFPSFFSHLYFKQVKKKKKKRKLHIYFPSPLTFLLLNFFFTPPLSFLHTSFQTLQNSLMMDSSERVKLH